MNYTNPVENKMNDPVKLFNALREKTISASKPVVSTNQNILKLQKDKTYSLRLLWLPSEVRLSPMINQYVHRVWYDSANGRRAAEVKCPTSEYDKNRDGFKCCPICDCLSKYYKEAQKGSESAEALYKKFKRTLSGFVPVYVVNGPDEDKHKVKLLHYTIQFKKYFDSKIFGIVSSEKDKNGNKVDDEIDESNVVGLDAFMYYDPNEDSVVTSGYNFIIRVGTQTMMIGGKSVEMPEYKLDFSMKKTDIEDFDGKEITPEYFKSLNAELQFDENFYIMSNEEELNNFKKKYIDGDEGASDEAEDEDDEIEPVVRESAKKPAKKIVEESSDEDDEEPEEIKKPAPKAKPAKKEEEDVIVEKKSSKVAKKVEVEEDDDDDDSDSDDDEDIDLDELLKDI
jgi:hypothetical protein